MTDEEQFPEKKNPPPPLAGKLMRGTLWTVSMRWGMRGLGLISTVILARLLVPEDFGLVAMAMAAIALLQVLTDFSVELALIRDKHATHAHFDTAWTIRILQHAVIALIVIAGATTISGLYGDERLIHILWVIALNVFISGFSNIGIVEFQRQLRFSEDFRYNMIAKALSVIVTVILAFTFRNYWALVFGMLSASLIRLPLSYILSPFRPRFSLGLWREIWGFSQWMLVRGIAQFIYDKADVMFLGRFSLPSSVGQYSISRELAELPTLELVMPVGRALLPGFAQLTDDPRRLESGFLRALGGVAILTFPAGFGVMLVADQLVPALLGSQWIEAIPLLKLLAVSAAILALSRLVANLFVALGRVKLWTAIAWLQALLIVAGLYPVYQKFGVIGVPMLHIGVSILSLVASFVALSASGLSTISKLLGAVIRPALAVGAMVAAILGLSTLDLNLAGSFGGLLILLIIKIALGASVYTASLFVLWLISGKPDGLEAEVVARMPRRAKS